MPDSDALKKDFDPDKLLQDHGKDISSLGDRVAALEQKLTNPEQLATTLEAATSDSKKLDKLFSKLFCDMMKNDKEVTASIQEKIHAMDRDSAKVFWKKFGGKVAAAVGAIIMLIVGALIDHYLKK
jgi:BMFP domain-containing protein YqiC